MFQKKTLIVVGAGASKEADLPVGSELTVRIANLLDVRHQDAKQTRGDTVLLAAIEEAVRRVDRSDGDIGTYVQACQRISSAMPQAMSIDSFMDAHRGDASLELCGKLAIVRAILQAERKSHLFFDGIRFPVAKMLERLKESWFNAFMQLLSENCRVGELAERLEWLSMIVFNYDRCIEHFLVNAIQNYYAIDTDQAEELVRSIEIYHPYGTVGALPWYAEEHAIAFGADPSAHQLLDLASQIKTFTEGTDPGSSDIGEIRKRVAEAQILLFLGFAFHRQNLDLIRPKTPPINRSREASCFATAVGISSSDCDLIAHEVARILNIPMSHIAFRPDLDCAGLFREFWRSLALS